jgi:serine/threonine-protein kinase
MQIDFSLHVVHALPGSPTRTTVSHPSGYYDPECEPLGIEMPVPPGAAIEGETGLSCDNPNNDCHLLVVQGDTLYEAYLVTEASATEIETHCLAVWHLGGAYPPEGRGDHCTSADAAGFPMSALLFNADEIQASLDSDPTGDGDLGRCSSVRVLGGRIGASRFEDQDHFFVAAHGCDVEGRPPLAGLGIRIRSSFEQ